METPQDPLAVYFRDNIFPGFTSSFLLHLRPISLCLLHRREITDLLFTTACSVLPVLENLPVSHQLPSRLLFCRQGNLQVLSLGACPLDLLSFWLPSSPLPKWMGLSWRAALQIEHRAPAERSPAWRLLPEGCTPRSIPVPCFVSFLLCNSSTSRTHVQLEDPRSPHSFLKGCCPTSCSHSSVNPLELHTTTAHLTTHTRCALATPGCV